MKIIKSGFIPHDPSLHKKLKKLEGTYTIYADQADWFEEQDRILKEKKKKEELKIKRRQIINENRRNGTRLEEDIENKIKEKNVWYINMTKILNPEAITLSYSTYFNKFFHKDQEIKMILPQLGCPDFALKLNNKIVFIEVKSGNATLSYNQRKIKEILETNGYNYFIVKTIADINRIINLHGARQ